MSEKFPLSTLAHISNGYSSGSIKKTTEKVLTAHRVRLLEQRPLTLSEFVGPLSYTHLTLADEYSEYAKFTDLVTGDGARREAIKAQLAKEAAAREGVKKEKKKKKKKK